MATNQLAERIVNEMVADHDNALEKYFETAKKYLKLTKSGKVEILVKDKLKANEQVALYVLGKQYAKIAGLSEKDSVQNDELLTELGMPGGTLRPVLKKLREGKIIDQVKGKKNEHVIMKNMIEKILKAVEKNVKG